jgi:hypothetical protein
MVEEPESGTGRSRYARIDPSAPHADGNDEAEHGDRRASPLPKFVPRARLRN